MAQGDYTVRLDAEQTPAFKRALWNARWLLVGHYAAGVVGGFTGSILWRLLWG